MASAPAEVPSHFLCPISLQIMRDPVTLPTGISYDRVAILRWLAAPASASSGRTCPVTRQPLAPEPQLTPNHTLRRLIHAWLASLSPGAEVDEDVTALRGPVSGEEMAALLSDAAAAQVGALKRLQELVAECEDNRAVLESQDGVFEVLSRVVSSGDACSTAREEAVGVLASLRILEPELVGIVARHANLGEALTAVLRSSNLKSRENAALLVRSVTDAAWPAWVIGLSQDLLAEVVRVVRTRISTRATKAALHALAAFCPYGRTRAKIVGAGAVPALVDLLLDEPERRVCELALAALDRLCTCAEGRSELVAHAAGLAVVGKKVLRVSEAASERAVRVLRSVARHAATPAVLQEMAQAGVVAKLCLALRSEQCSVRTKEKVHEVLKLHSRVWRSSPCLSLKFLALYPS
ncbi:E3 ubiquitin-protein ligase PUB23-like [Phragmites australis]|uniref:E3 ubiquitin-protein ligase PUB23-like n=1 Tax=Phragmites australis TaxID=29695 RepID=UPI002D785477|nr:E3 ubiquitin-protein ligase PUB23-like [Phragmites australis]